LKKEYYVLLIIFKETIDFLEKLEDMLDFLIPNYINEGKSQLIVAIGCTGGRHRSVAIAETLYKAFLEKQYRATVEHRDIEKDGKEALDRRKGAESI
jgi:UPF0042 nucleotide-binding protein